MKPSVYHGDCLRLLREMPAGSVDLIATDPPFNTGRVWEHKAGKFKDIFASRSAFTEYMRERVVEMKRVLSPTGSLYLHCDPKTSHYLKVMLDSVFGEECFRAEIIWRMGHVSGFKTAKKGWIRNHDVILHYSVDPAQFTFNKPYKPKTPEYILGFDKVDEEGRRYRRISHGGGNRRLYLDDAKGIPIDDVWNASSADILPSLMIVMTSELRGYPTQKPIALYERIIAASSNPGDLVLDPFCGSGTTLVAAHKLRRRAIGFDAGEEAVALARARVDEIAAQGLLDIA